MYNPFSLFGKCILVTGASSGIGRATAVECSKLGATLVLTGRNEVRLQETFDMLDGVGHQVIPFNLADTDLLDSFVDQIPMLDGLVNNAGITITTPVQFIKKESFNEILAVNTVAPALLIQKLLKRKRLSKRASVVFTCSVSGVYCMVPGNALYSLTKAATNAFMKSTAIEFAAKGLRFNSVCPGMVDTGILSAGIVTEEQLEVEKMKYPMKRFGEPREVALSIVFLLSDASSFITGTDIVIDGGFTLL